MPASSDPASRPPIRRRRAGAVIAEALIIAVAAVIPAGFSGFLHPKRPPFDGGASRVPEVTWEAVRTWQETPVWVDARKPATFQAGHIDGAVHLVVADFDTQLGSFLDAWEPGRPVVVYCDSADCGASQEVAARLRDEAGIPDVYVLSGGYPQP